MSVTTKPILLNETGLRMSEALEEIAGLRTKHRVFSLNETEFIDDNVVEVVHAPVYVSDPSQYEEFNLSDTGWYVFARIVAKTGVRVTANTTVSGAAGYVMILGEDYVDVAVRFGTTAEMQIVEISWGNAIERFSFRATDLAIRNLDYRTTFYVYDVAPYATWQYALTTDTEFAEDKNYYTEADGVYTLAEVTVGEAIPADTYYNHSKLHFEGMTRNVTYRLDEIVDCPSEIVLPEIENDTHGAWFEIQLRHAGSYSMTLLPPEGVKIATEHTQAESKGMNMIDLHYLNIDGVKLWRFMNTCSTIPTT